MGSRFPVRRRRDRDRACRGAYGSCRRAGFQSRLTAFPRSWPRSARADCSTSAASPDFDALRPDLLQLLGAGPRRRRHGDCPRKARPRRQTPRLEDVEVIFSMANKTRAGQHFGSRIVPRPDGTLFFTIGDRGKGARAQDMRDHAGAVLRINWDGSIPADNPSPDGSRHLPEIWSKGHRNPQGAAFDPLSTACSLSEHGARGGDEINRPEAGKNYGWPQISYGSHYSGGKIGVGSSAPGYRATALLLGPVDRTVRAGGLPGQNVPGMERRLVGRRAEIRACWRGSTATGPEQ